MTTGLNNVFIIGTDAEEALRYAVLQQQTGSMKEKALGFIKAADALGMQGKAAEAEAQLSEGQKLCNEMKYQEGLAAAMNVQSRIAASKIRDQDDVDYAEELANEALAIFQKQGSKYGEAAVLLTLASVHLGAGNSTEVLRSANKAKLMFAELGDQSATAVACYKMAGGYLLRDNTLKAGAMIERAKDIYQGVGNRVQEAACMHAIGKIELEACDFAKANKALEEAKLLYRTAGDYKGEVAVLTTCVEHSLSRKQIAEAVSELKAIVTVYHKAGDQKGEAEGLLKLGQTFFDNQETDKAGKMAEFALGIFMGIQDVKGMEAGKELLGMAKNQRTIEDIEQVITEYTGFVHIPETLIVDPTLISKMRENYSKFCAVK